MWITVRTFDGTKNVVIKDLSRLTKIEALRVKITEALDAPYSHQQLYFGGKLLVDGHSLFDYNIGHGQIMQLMIRAPVVSKADETNKSNDESTSHCGNESSAYQENLLLSSENVEIIEQSKYYKVGDIIDIKCQDVGAWFEGKIVDIRKSTTKEKAIQNDDKKMAQSQSTSCDNKSDLPNSPCDSTSEDIGVLYTVSYNDYESTEILSVDYIRPRARTKLEYDDISEGDCVMINYNIDNPGDCGFWYDFMVTGKQSKRASKFLTGNLLTGTEDSELQNCKIKFSEGQVFAIEKTIPLSDRKGEVEEEIPPARETAGLCSNCDNVETVKCKKCGCSVCGGKEEPAKLILCDECNLGYHLWCLSPPLTSLPEDDEWYCPNCKTDTSEVVKPGEKPKASKKRSQMASHSSTTSRDWGKGMACAGRTTQCTIVPSNHFGPIPGIEVGTMWKFRLQVSEAGVHRPHVAGIHGRENHGAFSIVLSGGYAEDEDNGDSFTYTGSGGRDLSGNKREGKQVRDQELTRMNKALAISCAAPFSKKGATAKDWKLGKPIRVVRNYKGAKHSEYAPKDGNRYDGIYKIAKYWPEKGESGFIVWRYLFHYDDSAPLPWTKAGKKRTKELGLEMQYPDGYIEDDEASKKKKRKQPLGDEEKPSKSKKAKVQFQLAEETKTLISKDIVNQKLWDECLKSVPEGNSKFLNSVTENFNCICCQEVVFNPVTTHCNHNICQKCMKNSFKAEVYSCPVCRAPLKKTAFQINTALQQILLKLFPGYEQGR